jgi:hypothetical protein
VYKRQPLNTTDTFKVLFDLSAAPDDPGQLSAYINTVARFLNMHVAAGKDRSQLEVAAVFHGNASYSLLKNQFYKEKFGVDNPNQDLSKPCKLPMWILFSADNLQEAEISVIHVVFRVFKWHCLL